MKYNANQLQEMYGVNRSTVRRWVKAGKIFADADGYVEESDFLVLFRKSDAWSKNREKLTSEQNARISQQLPLDTPNQLTGVSIPPPSNLAYTPPESFATESNFVGKPELQNAKLSEEIKEKRLKNAQMAGRLISRELVKRFMGRLGEIDNTEWRSLSTRVADDVMAICGASGAEVAVELTKRIDEEVFAILKSVQRSQMDFLEQLENGESGNSQ